VRTFGATGCSAIPICAATPYDAAFTFGGVAASGTRELLS